MPLTILYAEAHKIVADAVKETLEAEGWKVVLCSDGAMALRKISSLTRYDLFIVDHHLPKVNGLELASFTRQLRHRQDIPIIMLSDTRCEQEAYGAGVDVSLKKPEEIARLVECIKKLR